MSTDDPRPPGDDDDDENPRRRRPGDRDAEPIQPPRPETAGDFDDGPDAAEFLPPEIPEEELAGLRYSSSGVPLGPRTVVPLEEEPSPLIARYLFPTEKFRGEWKKHWIYLIREFLIGAAATFLIGWITGFMAKSNQRGVVSVLVIIWVLIMAYVAYRVADWYFDRFILTNKRIMVVNGLVTRTVGMMPLVRVTDMKYQQSALGRMLNYGTFVVESAGQDQALRKVPTLPNPNELYLRIVEEMYEPEAVEARLARMPDEGPPE
jgi:membrane protein YdbS with pleckstrin-like domain